MITIGTGAEQLPLSINRLLQDPLVVPELMRNLFRGQFVSDQVLRPAGKATGGAVQFWVSGPVFPDVTLGDVEVVAPLGEIPVVNPIVGSPASALVLKRGLGLRLSREIQDRNDVGIVLRGMTQIRNAMVRSVDAAMIAALRAGVTQTVAAGAPWGNATGTTIRKDIASAQLILRRLQTQGYDYQADTILAGVGSEFALRLSSEFLAPFIGQAAAGSPALTGTVGTKLWDMNWLFSPNLPDNEAWVLQSNVVGGIADERGAPGQPIELSDPFYEPAHEATRWNVTRAAAGFIDNPGACVHVVGT